MSQDEEAKLAESRAREAGRRRDAEDLGNEMAGRDVGRIKRFLPNDADPAKIRKRREQDHERLSALITLLQNDPAYAALYQKTLDLVQDHAAKAEAGVKASQAELSAAGQTLEAITDKAARLHPNGDLVFRDENGRAVRADGTALSLDEAASIAWPDDAPSYEQYREAKRAYDEAQAQLQAWLDYQLYLGSLQNRLNDSDNLLAPDELKEIQREVEQRYQELQDTPEQTRTSDMDSAFNLDIPSV